MLRKVGDGKFKKYWFCLLDKELYCYRKKSEDKHKSMSNLVGVYIKEVEEEALNEKIKVYPFKLIFPPNQTKIFYLITAAERDSWIKVIK
jgi:hypothetical protein